MNPHLTQIWTDRKQEDSVVVSVGLSPRKAGKKERSMGIDFSNFRELVSDATGIEAADQKLFFATRRLNDDEKTLADYGVGQGGTVTCFEHKQPQGPALELASTQARQKLVEQDTTGNIRGKLGSLAACLPAQRSKPDACKGRLMLRWQHEHHPQTLHHLEAGKNFHREQSSTDYDAYRRMPTRTDTHDYRNLRDNGCYDYCDPIRNRFESLEKAAIAAQAHRVSSAPATQQ
jgi:hypothetical protein